VTVLEAYEILGLDGARASADETRARFRDLIRANHPDRAPRERQARANERTRALVEAYTFLRERGYPRVDRTLPAGWYEPPEEPEEAPAQPSGAVRAAWCSFGALALLTLGIVVLGGAVIAGQWIAIALGVVWIIFGIRLAAAARRSIREVLERVRRS
jgi:hypothetical protein